MLSLGLNDEDSAAVNECLRLISLSKEKINSVPENIDELQQVITQTDVSGFDVCALFVSTAMNDKLVKLQQNQTMWVERYITPILDDNGEMSVVDCSNWLDRTSTVPVYLGQEILEQYKRAKSIVEKRLHKSRVQGVFVMYDKLSEDEKREFKRMINI